MRAPLWRRHYGNLVWDGILRASGVAAVGAIPATLYSPDFAAVTGFVLVTIWLNGPLAPIFPASYEPVLMVFGRFYPPLLIATLGTAGTIYVEYLNYHLYRRLLSSSLLTAFRQSRTINWLTGIFQRSPFFTIWLCAWSPLPYWAVRFLSPMAGYPVTRHLVATLLGRFPRLWFFAALGAWWHPSLGLLGGIAVGSILLAVAVWLAKGRPRPASYAAGPSHFSNTIR